MTGRPIADDDLVDLVDALAGLRRELAGAGVVIRSQVDVDPAQRFGPWTAVLDAVRAGVATLEPAVAGTLLERTPAAADALAVRLATSEAAAVSAGRSSAADEAVVAAIQDAAVLAERVVDGEQSFVFTVESFYAGLLAATYATWVARDLLGPTTADAGTGLVDLALRPVGSLRRLGRHGSAAAVLDVAAALPVETWAALAGEAVERPEAEAMASVTLRALAAVAGLGGAEAAVVARLAPADLDLAVAGEAAVVIGDAAVGAAAPDAVVDAATRALAERSWQRVARR